MYESQESLYQGGSGYTHQSERNCSREFTSNCGMLLASQTISLISSNPNSPKCDWLTDKLADWCFVKWNLLLYKSRISWASVPSLLRPSTTKPTLPSLRMCSPDSVQAHNNSLNNLAPIEHTNLPFISIPPPLDDSAKCSLTLIRPGDLLSVHAEIFLQGEEPNTRICIPSYAFLIEKQVDGKLTRLLYEMGLRNVGTMLKQLPRWLFQWRCSHSC